MKEKNRQNIGEQRTDKTSGRNKEGNKEQTKHSERTKHQLYFR